jgi:hypothetical protein
MLKLTPIRKKRIPNTLAIAGALLLLVSTLAGVERPDSPAESTVSLAGTAAETMVQPTAAPEPLGQAPAKQARKFRVNLFLFRH